MSDKKDPKIVILIVFIVDFSTKKQNILYNYSLIITKRILLKSFCSIFNFWSSCGEYKTNQLDSMCKNGQTPTFWCQS